MILVLAALLGVIAQSDIGETIAGGVETEVCRTLALSEDPADCERPGPAAATDRGPEPPGGGRERPGRPRLSEAREATGPAAIATAGTPRAVPAVYRGGARATPAGFEPPITGGPFFGGAEGQKQVLDEASGFKDLREAIKAFREGDEIGGLLASLGVIPFKFGKPVKEALEQARKHGLFKQLADKIKQTARRIVRDERGEVRLPGGGRGKGKNAPESGRRKGDPGTKQRSSQLTSRIADDPLLVREAQRAGRSVQHGLDRLQGQLAQGNLDPGVGSRSLFAGVIEARSRGGARLYFRKTSGGIEILGKSSKANQRRVINRLEQLYGR